MMMLVFNTKKEAIDCLAQIDMYGRALYAEAGYTVVDGGIVGKSAKSGQDAPSAALTTTWDIVQELPDNKWGFANPRARYPQHFDTITKGFDFEEAQVQTEFTDEFA